MTYEEIERVALDLGPEDRSRLAEILLQSVSDSISIAWAVESLWRLRELEAGTAREFPLDEVLQRARAAVATIHEGFEERHLCFSGAEPMTFNDILDEALKLGEEDRSILADLLFASLDEIDEAECLQLWGVEASRRLKEFDRGLSGEISSEDALREVRESLSRSRLGDHQTDSTDKTDLL